MTERDQEIQDTEEAAIAFGNLGINVSLPTIMMDRSLSPSIVRASIASKTVLDPEVLEVASILTTEGDEV